MEAPKTQAPVGFVRGGGTSTWEQDKADQQAEEDARRRRAYAQKLHTLAREMPDQARLYTNNMGTSSAHAAIVLRVRDKTGGENEFEVCELNHAQTPTGEEELTLLIVCPVCAITRGQGHKKTNIMLHSATHPFTVDTRKRAEGGVAGEIWVNPCDPGEVVHQAGSITMHRAQACPNCGWRFIIDNNLLRGA